MNALVLAGGKGTRLASVVYDVPKPLAPINGTPFLTILLDNLFSKGIDSVVLSVGYKADIIINEFKNNTRIRFSIESAPLLTGGAIKKGLSKFCRDSYVLIVNGDTFVNVDYDKLIQFHIAHDADITVACPLLHNFDRYGTVAVDSDDKILQFKEKEKKHIGLINGGVYCLRASFADNFNSDIFSFEKWLEDNCLKYKIMCYRGVSDFIDIGIPADYFRAQSIFAEMK